MVFRGPVAPRDPPVKTEKEDMPNCPIHLCGLTRKQPSANGLESEYDVVMLAETETIGQSKLWDDGCLVLIENLLREDFGTSRMTRADIMSFLKV